jgi:hypothetical protein
VGFCLYTARSYISSRQILSSTLRVSSRFVKILLALTPIGGYGGGYLRRNASKEEIHDVGGAIIIVRSDTQYFKFLFVDSVQHWRNKWLYVKDKKSS